MSASRTLDSLDSRSRRWLNRDVTNCWRSSAALYSEFSRRSPCARAFSISFGSTKLISWFRRSTSAWSLFFRSSIIARTEEARHYTAPMPLDIRTYHDLTEPDRSGLLSQVLAQRRRVAERLAPVKRVVAVMSGKGGVGKSFVTAQLARAAARAGRPTGVLDADLNGPTAARLLEAGDGPLVIEGD